MVMFLVLMSIASVLAEETAQPQQALKETQVGRTKLTRQLKVWISILMIIVPLWVSYKINGDNKPNPQKDSLLYAKFLTSKLERKNE